MTKLWNDSDQKFDKMVSLLEENNKYQQKLVNSLNEIKAILVTQTVLELFQDRSSETANKAKDKFPTSLPWDIAMVVNAMAAEPQEIKIDGIGISPDVLTAIVSRAVSDVEGIASVGVKDLATNLVSMMLSSKAPASEPAVEAEVVGDKLALTVRVVVFFGYPFKKLAEAVRAAVVAAIDAQVGVEVERVDVCIDGLVFPKE